MLVTKQNKNMMFCRNFCFVISIVSICIGNGESNENLESQMKTMENNFLKMNQAIEARMESNFLKMNQAIEQIRLKLDSGNNPTAEGLRLTKETKVPTMNDTDLENRVLALEFQMENVQDDFSDVETEVTNIELQITNIEGQITIIHAGQLNQDEKIEDVEDVSEGLDTRVTTLEDEDASDESITEAINKLISDVLYLNNTVDVLDSRLETLEALDVNAEIENLDSRLDALELDGTVAFHVGFTDSYPVVPVGGVAVWDYIFFNLGDGYNSVTDEFVVPPSGAGLYYFNINYYSDDGEAHRMNIRHHGEYLCTAHEDRNGGGDYGGSACGALVQLADGDAVDVYHEAGTDDTPCLGEIYSSTLSGFRIAPV